MLPELEQALARLDLIYLEHSGRSSGQTYSTEISFAYEAGSIYLLAHLQHGTLPDWLQNSLAAGSADFYAGVRRLRAHAELLADSRIAAVQSMFRAKYGAEVVRKWYEGTPHVAIRLSRLEIVGPREP